MRPFHYRKFPGDTIVVPMVIGVLLNSFVPQFLEIGSFWTAMTKNGTAPLVGVFLFFIGASMVIRSTGKAVAKGTVIILTKIVLAVLLGYAAAFLFHDNIFGLSSLAIIGALGLPTMRCTAASWRRWAMIQIKAQLRSRIFRWDRL